MQRRGPCRAPRPGRGCLSEGSGEGATPTLGESIGNGHDQDKHAEEFEEIDIGAEDLPQFIDDVIQGAKETEGRVFALEDKRTVCIDPETETVVIHDPNHPDLGAAFRPRGPGHQRIHFQAIRHETSK